MYVYMYIYIHIYIPYIYIHIHTYTYLGVVFIGEYSRIENWYIRSVYRGAGPGRSRLAASCGSPVSWHSLRHWALVEAESFGCLGRLRWCARHTPKTGILSIFFLRFFGLNLNSAILTRDWKNMYQKVSLLWSFSISNDWMFATLPSSKAPRWICGVAMASGPAASWRRSHWIWRSWKARSLGPGISADHRARGWWMLDFGSCRWFPLFWNNLWQFTGFLVWGWLDRCLQYLAISLDDITCMVWPHFFAAQSYPRSYGCLLRNSFILPSISWRSLGPVSSSIPASTTKRFDHPFPSWAICVFLLVNFLFSDMFRPFFPVQRHIFFGSQFLLVESQHFDQVFAAWPMWSKPNEIPMEEYPLAI